MSPDVQSAADALVPVPLHPAAARRALSAARLDVLVFADTTSEPLAWCLSLGRLAPVQAAFWGNPTTTGHGDAVDYFLSGDVLEAAQGAQLYDEQVVRMQGQGIWCVAVAGGCGRCTSACTNTYRHEWHANHST